MLSMKLNGLFSDKVKVVENRGKSKFEVFIKEPEKKNCMTWLKI